MVTAGADYLVAATKMKGKDATAFAARVGDPSLYIDRGALDHGAMGRPDERIWSTPAMEVQKEMEKSKARPAVVVDAKNFGKRCENQ